MGVGFAVIQNDITNPMTLLAALGNAIVFIDKSNGNMTILVGVPTQKGYKEGNITEARFHTITGIIQTNMSLILADSNNNCLRKVLISAGAYNSTETYCGKCRNMGHKDSSILLDARFNIPISIIGEPDKIYVLETDGTLRLVLPSGTSTLRFVSPLSQISAYSLAIDPFSGSPIIAQRCALYYPNDELYLQLNDTGPSECSFQGGFEFLTKELIIAVDQQGAQVHVLDLTGQVHATMCTGRLGALDGPIDTCRLYDPSSVFVDENTIYIGEFSLEESSGIRAISFNASSEGWFTKPTWVPATPLSTSKATTQDISVTTSSVMTNWRTTPHVSPTTGQNTTNTTTTSLLQTTSINTKAAVLSDLIIGLVCGIIGLLFISGVVVRLYVRGPCHKNDADAAVQDTAGEMVYLQRVHCHCIYRQINSFTPLLGTTLDPNRIG